VFNFTVILTLDFALSCHRLVKKFDRKNLTYSVDMTRTKLGPGAEPQWFRTKD